MLHRDVKPSNVLMEGRTPILIDFGLARVADDPKLTHTGWLLGTPGYLAPEILYGDDATTASDVHSWAATVAYAATGRPPFGRGPSMAIMDRVRRGEHDLSGIPEPLRRCSPRRSTPSRTTGRRWPRSGTRWRRAAGLADGARAPPARADDDAVGGRRRDRPRRADRRPARERRRRRDAAAHRGADGRRRGEWDEAWSATEVTTGAPWQERLRRGTLLSAGALVCGAAVAAYPWFGSLALVLLTWVLRSGSLAASAAGDRRRVRGRKWYDGAQFLLRTPWDLVRSIPITAMLVVWSAGLAVAAALLCYAFVAGERLTLAVCGTTFAVAVWTGPGRLAGADAAGPGGQPAVPRLAPWAAAIVVTIVAAMAVGAARRAARHAVDARRGPSAVRTAHRTRAPARGTMSPMQHRVIIIA